MARPRAADRARAAADRTWVRPPPPLPSLPPPSVWRVELPAFDAEQQKRADEVEQYLAKQYQAQGWKIVETTQTFLGDIMDWLDPASVPGSQVEPPPKQPTPEEMKLPDGVQLSLTELDVFPELRGPAGTIPVMRPSFAAYIMGLGGASSLEDFLNKYVVPGDPSGQDRLYAGIISPAPNLGASAWINSFNGMIDFNTMSLLEMVVGCRDPNTHKMVQQIGIAASKDWASTSFENFGDSVLRIQVEFLTVGSRQDDLGNGKGGWVGTKSLTDFIPAAGAPYSPGVAILNPSAIGGPQFESRFQIQRQDNGDWWVGWNGNWLGYYPGKLFDVGTPNLTTNACEAEWYGEVYDPSATTSQWTWTDMGSGQFASAGFGNAANFRNPSYIDLSGKYQWPDQHVDIPTPLYNPACYTKTDLTTLPSPWDRFFYIGGPGGDAPSGGCPSLH